MDTFNVYVSNFLFFEKSHIKDNLLKKIKSIFIYSNPKYFKNKNLGIHNKKYKSYFKTYIETDERIYITRGEYYKLKELLINNNIKVNLIDYRSLGSPINFQLINLKNYPFQNDAVDTIVKKSQYLLRSPCGSGKTTMSLKIIEKLKTTTLVIVPLLSILEQWIDVIKKRGIYDFEIGRICTYEKKVKPITIALFQSLYKYTKEQWNDINKYFGCIIFDECHRVASESIYNIVNRSKAKYRYGVSATMNRSDNMEFLLNSAISYNMYNITKNELKKSGIYMTADIEFIFNKSKIKTSFPKVIKRSSIFYKEYQQELRSFYRNLVNEILEDENRKNIILKNVLDKIKNGYKILILSPSVSWNESFYKEILTFDKKIGLIIGKTTKKERENLLNNFKNEDINAIIATDKIASEGLDIPNLSNVQLVVPPKSMSTLEQMCGRALRFDTNKLKPTITDYVDINSIYMMNNYKKRISWYKKSEHNIL